MTRRGGSGVDGWRGRLRRPGVGWLTRPGRGDACVALGWGGSRDQDEGDASVPSPHRPTPAPTGKRHPSLCHHPQGGDTLLTDVNAGGSDASIAVVRSHDVNPVFALTMPLCTRTTVKHRRIHYLSKWTAIGLTGLP